MKTVTYDTRFPLYDNKVKSVKPIGTVSVINWLKLIYNPEEDLKKIFDKLKFTEDKIERTKLKEHLYYSNPAVMTNMIGRSYNDIVSFTGILPLDFDKIEFASEFRDYLFETYEFVFASWLSASGKGVRAFVSIPICTSVDEFKSYFWGLANEIMFKYKGFDIAPQNCVLPMFLSNDSDIKAKDITTIWTKKGVNPKEEIKKTEPYKVRLNSDERYYKFSVENTVTAINKIVDNGHPQLRAAAFAMGGYVAAGYIGESEAIDIVNGLIDSNTYLQKGLSGYKKTAKEMIIKGQSKPLFFS